ncbi:quinoprotein relay system zinc metallohydrolase 2 [Aureimonas fodinaquatilis]|uniref:quinoprotein relay system zinc metallohydrolase 2 n=1 Tax=Aureimonas fodinaquatilis TaxID=2565783 RepID=UPI00165E7807|nr:quinoprotein relay system zinc metallohydrolase 2 [Aureimonas fodinaquatilis]
MLHVPALAGSGEPAFALIAPGVYAHIGDIALPTPETDGNTSNSGFVIGNSSVAVIDSGGSPEFGLKIRAAVASVTDLPISHVILTHMHPDHSAGAASLTAEGAELVAHHNFAASMEARKQFYAELEARRQAKPVAEFEFALPDIGVDDRMEIDLGDRTLVLQAWPTAHTDNDLTVLDTRTRTLFAGDLLFVRHVPTLDGSLKGWLAIMPELAGIAADRVVPGHGQVSEDWHTSLDAQKQFLNQLADDTRAFISQGQSLGLAQTEAAASERSKWLLFDDYQGQNASAAYSELEWE